jgi:hypothetical protein
MPIASTLTPARARRRRAPRSRRGAETPAASRGRSAGPTEDRALYRCGCGHAFRADVTASVGCPRCGTGQPW